MTVLTDRPFTAASFNQWIAEKKLMGSRCTRCGSIYLPPRAICLQCHSDQLAWTEMSGKGRLAAYTSIYIGPTLMTSLGYGRNNPYLSGIVELDEGVKISARILGLDPSQPSRVQVGTPLTVDFHEEGEGERKRTVLAFRA